MPQYAMCIDSTTPATPSTKKARTVSGDGGRTVSGPARSSSATRKPEATTARSAVSSVGGTCSSASFDVQVNGPYAGWEHRHRLLEEGGGRWVEDRVTYRLPGGPLGRAAHAVLVGRQLRAAWAYRRERLIALL